MHLSLNLVQKQQQSLYMSQQMRQAMKILQLSALDLQTYVQHMSVENPLIEIDTYHCANVDEWMKKHEYIIYNFSQSKMSLQDFLLSQLGELNVHPKLKKVITLIIYHLDEKGYFSTDIQAFCSNYQIDPIIFQKALNIVQSFEPIGIGATNLQQCILIQLRHLTNLPPLAELIIEQYYDLFINKRWDQLAETLSTTVTEIQQVADLMKKVNFRPAELFITEQPRYIIPDLFIEKIGNELIVVVNDEILPSITLNEQYVSMLKHNNTKKSLTFMKEKFEQAKWIIRSIEQRKKTLFTVATAIIEQQKDYFLSKNGELKPLTLKDIANIVGIHESTVSRAVQSKYVQTPKGLCELKMFFSTAIQTMNGETTSAYAVKEKIRSIIKFENKDKPYSDSKIAQILADQNIRVARRTVAKYREELGIGSSVIRRRIYHNFI